MLQQALNRHSQVIIPPETKFFFSFLGHSRKCQLRHLARINVDLGIKLPPPDRRIKSDDDARAFYEKMAEYYVATQKRGQPLYFGEKTPEHTGRLFRISRLFPKAKIIFIYRDGRDVALSLSQVPWMHTNVHVNFVVWLYYYRVLRRAQKDHGLDLYCVKYEDLVTDPAAGFQKITSFLELSYEPAVAQGLGNPDSIPLREHSWKGRALERINTDRIGTWRRELPLAQVKTLESLGGNALKSLGYPLTDGDQRRMSPKVLAGLTWGLCDLAWRLPWHGIASEFLGWSMCRPWFGEAQINTEPEPTI
jgi:hypothetical protein